MPRKRNSSETRELTIRTTPRIVQLLDALAKAGAYGKNPSEVAEEFVREGVRRIYGDQAIAGLPPKPED
jgi:hypothetical protein